MWSPRVAFLTARGRALYYGACRAISSVGEHCLHTAGVAGSNPASPTNQINQLESTTPLDWVTDRLFVTALSHSFANERNVAMASFRKRGPYQWQAQVRKRGHPLQTKTFETRAQAEQWARAIEVEMDKGVFVSRAEAESTTLEELLERYLAEVTPLKKGAEPETYRLRLFMRQSIAQRFVAGIRGVDIARWRDERLRKVTSATVKRDLVLLSHVFEVARKEWGIYVHNPVRDIKLPAGGRPRERRLRAGEEPRLMAACRQARNHWLLPIVQLALETAMRQGELLRLGWEHIDLNRRTA